MASPPGWVLSDLFRLGCGRHPGLHPEQSFLLSFRHSAKVGASSSRCFPAGFGCGGWYRHSSLSPTGLVKPPSVLPGWTTAAARVTFILLGAESLFSSRTLSRTRCHWTTVGVRLLSSLCGLAIAKCPPWHLTAGLGSWSCPDEPLLSPGRMAAPCRGQSNCSPWMLCVPGCAWRPWRWEQGRKDAHPVGYKAFPSSAVPSGVCMCSHCIQAHHSTSMIWALENLGTFLL